MNVHYHAPFVAAWGKFLQILINYLCMQHGLPGKLAFLTQLAGAVAEDFLGRGAEQAGKLIKITRPCRLLKCNSPP